MQSTKFSGPWSKSDVIEFLQNSVIPVRIAAVADDGSPRVVSLWFLVDEEKIFCACKKTAHIAQVVSRNPKVGFEIAGEDPPYFGIRGTGTACLDQEKGQETLRRLADRYIGEKETDFRRWLMAGAADEVAIEITLNQIFSWDYRDRMSR